MSAPSTLVVRQARGPRRSGDDLIADLFEACCDLGFLGDPLDGAEFVLSLVLGALHCRLALVSFFDINTREFVVVRQGLAQGTGQDVPNIALTRASEKTALIAKAMASHRAIVLDGRAAELVAEDPRWRALGLSPRTLVCAPVESGGRYLGLIEVADSLDGAEFSESDGHALTYVGNQLAEYLSQRELVLDPERVTRPKLAQVSRRPPA